jgi:hypothetical protein
MKNIHVLPTDKPSRLIINWEKDLCYKSKPYLMEGTQNIYITSDEEIKNGDYVIVNGLLMFTQNKTEVEINAINQKNNNINKIILTIDTDLIKDSVQAIDDEFLEWFVKNPSCEKVETERFYSMSQSTYSGIEYEIIIPKEEPKTAWVGVLHDKLNEYYPAEYELRDIYQGEGCLPNFPNEELCQIWCDSKYKEVPKQETTLTSEEFFRKKLKELNPLQSSVTLSREMITAEQGMIWAKEYSDYINKQEKR